MTQLFEITGMHCGGCASRAQRAVEAIAPGAVVTVDPPHLTLPEGVTLTAEAVDAALATMGDYRVRKG
jgi:copper chaperone